MDFAVVRFNEKNEFSEIPSNWLVDGEFGERLCKWPPPIIKNVNYFIKSRYLPKEDWLTYKVEVLRYCDSLETARKAAVDADYTSSEEAHRGRGRRIKRPKILSDSDTSDAEEFTQKGKRIPPPSSMPKLNKPTFNPKQMEKTRDGSVSFTSVENTFQCEKDEEESGFETLNTADLPSIDNDPLSSYEYISRHIKLLEEKSDAVLNLLGKVVVCMKDIQQQLALKNSNDTGENFNRKDLQVIKCDLPLETKEAIEDFEKLLSKPQYYKEFTLMIKQIGGTDGKDYTERIFSRIFSPFFAKSNTWDGKVSKYPVKDLTLINTIEEIILSKFPFWSSAEFEKVAANWLRLGNQRAGEQPAQKKKQKNEEGSTY